jgi:hypothetical protein
LSTKLKKERNANKNCLACPPPFKQAEINNIEKIRGNLKEGKKKLNVSSKKGSNGIIITSNGVK